MAYAFQQDLPITREIYQRIRTALGEVVPPGLIVHLVTDSPTGSGLRVIDIWESKEACEQFLTERVQPALEQVFAAAGRPQPPEAPRDELEVIDLWRPRLAAAGG